MRLDAKKLLTHYRRPVSQRVRSIGVWYRILDSIGKLSVITNVMKFCELNIPRNLVFFLLQGFIIAFTSDFIPRLIYSITSTTKNHPNSYLNFTLSVFDVADFKNGTAPPNNNITHCYYQDFRQPAGFPNEYEETRMYWIVMAARFIFVVLFENIVVIVMIFVRWVREKNRNVKKKSEFSFLDNP